jgi:hypothetical protein
MRMHAFSVIAAAVAVLPVRAVIPVPAFPSTVAVGGGSVWVLGGGRLVRINQSTDKVIARISLGVRVGSERTCDLAVAGGLVWTIGTVNARRSRVVRVDARTGRVLGSTQLPSAACVAATAQGAWVTLPEARALVRLDRHGHALKRLATHAYCDAIVAGHGAVWAACPEETAGAAIGLHTGTILRVTARGKISVVAHDVLAGALAAGAAGVFASGVGHNSGATVRVDSSGAARFLSSGQLAVGQSMLWVADWRGAGLPGFVQERNARTGHILRTFHAGTSPFGIALGAGAVWVSDYTQPGSVIRIVP